jgi:hypothetical protein
MTVKIIQEFSYAKNLLLVCLEKIVIMAYARIQLGKASKLAHSLHLGLPKCFNEIAKIE